MINIAVIGCGYWGPNLVRNFAVNPKTRLTWCCDVDRNRLDKISRPYPGVQNTRDLKAVLMDKSIHAVAIATPVDTHFSVAKACLENGKHVLIEKPLASNLLQGEKLVKLAKEKNLKLMCDHTFCYTSPVRKIKKLLENGNLGKPLYFDSVRINLGLFQRDINVVWDLAPHDLSILDFLIGDQPIRVSASGRSYSGDGLESVAYVLLNYASSFMAHFHISWLSPVKVRKTILCCSEKMLVWDDLDPSERIKVYDKGIDLIEGEREKKDRILVSYRSGDIFVPHLDTREALSVVVEEFVDSIEQNRSPLTDGNSGLRVLRILEAAQKSIKSNGASIAISEDNEGKS